MRIIERILPVGQVATPKEIRVKLEEARDLLRDEISEKQFVPKESGDYRMETFALSSCIYARVSIELISVSDEKRLREESHVA